MINFLVLFGFGFFIGSNIYLWILNWKINKKISDVECALRNMHMLIEMLVDGEYMSLKSGE